MASNTVNRGGDSHASWLPVNQNESLPSNEFRELINRVQKNEEILMRDFLDILMRRKWLIVTVLMLVFLSTLIYTLASTKIYRATAVVEVNQETPQVTKFEDILGSKIQAREFYETQVELIRSKTMINRLIDNIELLDHPVILQATFGDERDGLFQRIRKAIKSLTAGHVDGHLGQTIDAEVVKRQRVADYLSNRLTVIPSRKSMLIEVSFSSPDRTLSQNIVNSMVEDYISWKMEQKLEASGLARDFLMMQIDRAKITLEKSEEQLNQFAKHAGIVSLDTKLNSVYRHLDELNTAVAAAESDLITKKATYQQAVKDGHANLPRILDSDLIASLKDKYAELSTSYEDLKTTFHDDYPKAKMMKARLDKMAEMIKAEENGIIRAIKNEYESAQQIFDAIQKRTEYQKKLVLDLNDRATQYTIMEREVETNHAIYQSLLQRAKEIESVAGVSSSNVQIVSHADIPLLPVSPNIKLNLLLAVLIGSLGGIGCAFLAEYFADTVTNPQEISDRFQIPLLGTVPQTKPDQHGLENSFLRHPLSPFSESIRSSRVSIQLSGSEARSKCCLVTSTLPSEGKTTLAVNLAASFAAAGEKTVIIDADLRKPRLQDIFNLKYCSSGGGLSSFLAGVNNKLKFYNKNHKNLWIIPSGPTPPNPAELLASRRFKILVKNLANRFDRIILDGPPHIGFADTLILSKSVGGIVLICSIGETSREAIKQFKNSIYNVRGNILGCIINKVDFSRKYGYGGYYRSYHQYSSYSLKDSKAMQLSVN